MAFSKIQPADTTKIRNLGTVLRANFEAQEEGDSSFEPYAINLQNRTSLGVANDPVAITDDVIHYVKDDAAGNPEAFMIDEDSNIIQLSAGGYLGGPTTDVHMENFTMGATGEVYTENNIVTARGLTTEAGVLTDGFGMTVAHTDTGLYTYTFDTAMANANYTIIGTCFSKRILSGLIPTYVYYTNIFTYYGTTTASFIVRIVDMGDDRNDSAHSVIVVGGRV